MTVQMTTNEFRLPDVGEGLTEAEIVTWRVAEGDIVAINDVVVEIETAKSIVELPSPYAGEVLALLVPEGQTVEVGTPIIRIGKPGAAVPDRAPIPASVPPASEVPIAPGQPGAAGSSGSSIPSSTEVIDTNIPPEGADGSATLVGYGPKQRELKRRPRKRQRGVEEVAQRPSRDPRPPVAGDRLSPVEVRGAQATSLETTRPADEEPAQAPPAPAHRARALAKPLVRRLARDLGVDLTAVVPTGPKGTVSKEDVLAVASGGGTAGPRQPAPATGQAPAAASPSGDPARETREPIKGLRKHMAAAMVASASSAPHVTEWVTIDATATVELVERLRTRSEFRDIRVTPLLVIARASLLALRRTPLVNSTWDEPAQEIVVKDYVNLGIAAATPRGLVVPNIKDAQDLSLPALGGQLDALIATAREGKSQPADQAGGTFTITNVGVFGVDGGTPIINPGESAILCLGAIKPQPWVVGDEVVPRQVMTLSLSFDHRHIDGATGSQFLADVAEIVGDPATALLF